MKVRISAHIVEPEFEKIGQGLRKTFIILCERLEGDYGGVMEHLWIDFELAKTFARPDGKPKFSFRFAKRVSGRSHFGLPALPDSFNVGHFSVRPDFDFLLTLTDAESISYCLSLVYNELNMLKHKEKKLEGFNSELLRNRFHDECLSLGYKLA